MTFKDDFKRWGETILQKTLDRFQERKEEFSTSSSIPIPLRRSLLPHLHYPEARLPRRVPVHARRAADHVPRPLLDHAPVRRLRHRRGVEPALPLPARAGSDRPVRGLRPADPDRLRRRRPDRAGRSGQGGRLDRLPRRHGAACSTRSRSTRSPPRMTINAPAAVLLAMYIAVARRQGVDVCELRGTIQNDILKEYIARGTYIFPPAPSMRMITDIFAYCSQEVPQLEHDLHQRLPHPRGGLDRRPGGGLHAGQRHRLRAGGHRKPAWTWTTSPRSCPSFSTRTTTSSRRSPSSARPGGCGRGIMRDRFEAPEPASWQMRFHTQTAGSTLTAQQPENNVVRVTMQALAAVLGGTQCLHTNSMDEALWLPTEKSVRVALRTQQIIAYESGVADSVDPLAGLLPDRVPDRRDRKRRGGSASKRSTRWAAR